MEDMKWLGLHWDEGELRPVRQPQFAFGLALMIVQMIVHRVGGIQQFRGHRTVFTRSGELGCRKYHFWP